MLIEQVYVAIVVVIGTRTAFRQSAVGTGHAVVKDFVVLEVDRASTNAVSGNIHHRTRHVQPYRTDTGYDGTVGRTADRSLANIEDGTIGIARCARGDHGSDRPTRSSGDARVENAARDEPGHECNRYKA